ncbi:MAG: RecQ family ATP-dependent DNA helicase [Prevotella sp.]|nr:RecQ family ATP-dependent DNA helicase [Prevotella sp.]MBR1461849.1 RecQ family ATP-dependent DNA helicase [Prevotella sp.]
MTYRDILRHYWHYEDFRGIQRDIIESICAGRDTLGLMPTGGGKSITFQVPAMAMDGVCIVITPLIALMKDQVTHLRKIGILAAAIYGSMRQEEIVLTLENCIFGGVKILYVSPERLDSELFQTKLRHMKVSIITVDEAHCISQWGYDFRPSYLKIANIRKLKPNVPVLALTATATPQVIEDIQLRLGFKEKNVFRMSFERKNLAYIVRKTTDKYEELLHILNSVDGCGIVYVRSRKRTKEIAELLMKHSISALAYHAGLDSAIRDERQKEWHDDRVRIMVATNAFGMGIDKADVRIVIHFDCPDSLEAYFQEAGRAGRDGRKSYAVLLYNDSDERKLNKRISDTFPEKSYIREIYEHLAYYYQIGIGSGYGASFVFDIDKFCATFKHFPIQTDAALKILTRAGYIDYTEERDNQARVHFLIDRNDFYQIESLTEKETHVITALLRNYGGLFTNFEYIDEAFVAQQAGLQTAQQVYMILKNLSEKHILSFIPQRKTPFITYTERREDPERIIIGREIYEDRKEQYRKRIEEVIKYAKNDDVCRSRQLLRYFGETKSNDCDQCDVCIAHREDYLSDRQIKPAKELIKELLSDGKKHLITELNTLSIPHDKLHAALTYLIDEEEIFIEDNMLHL